MQQLQDVDVRLAKIRKEIRDSFLKWTEKPEEDSGEIFWAYSCALFAHWPEGTQPTTQEVAEVLGVSPECSFSIHEAIDYREEQDGSYWEQYEWPINPYVSVYYLACEYWDDKGDEVKEAPTIDGIRFSLRVQFDWEDPNLPSEFLGVNLAELNAKFLAKKEAGLSNSEKQRLELLRKLYAAEYPDIGGALEKVGHIDTYVANLGWCHSVEYCLALSSGEEVELKSGFHDTYADGRYPRTRMAPHNREQIVALINQGALKLDQLVGFKVVCCDYPIKGSATRTTEFVILTH